ncbi:glycosyltransferase family 2 protein [Anaerostipes butyraticus]|uniref:Glycosyltransferase 2-like domain-containing protein n=1 Tax=Anaerostipes butyraticus TaxID=645466 RepID=A0A916VDZ3_9FIRM|nr:glycosyltransferase family 2 protein [Anaerostipes butyraticus]GFO86211.1 hypothetical protein ANBU17_25580 [Anaerostipes butyraticus]
MKVEVSIVIPAYNIASYVGKCLESVLAQTLKDIEVIVVDDGSTDETVEVIKLYKNKDKRIKLIQKENGGVTSARLAGIRVATGEYIGFVDGDDQIEADMYERLLANAIKYHADISHCGYQMVFPKRVDYYYNTGRLIQQNNITGLKDLISGEFVEPGLWNKVFHKKLFYELLKKDLMDLKIKYNEDLLMNYFLFKESNNAIYEDWCPYHYMIRGNSATGAALSVQKLMDPIKVLMYIESESVCEKELQDIVLKRLAYQLVNISSMNMKHKKEFLIIQQEVREMLKNRMPQILRNAVCSKKDKLAALWVSIWPWSYGFIHRIYAHITGIDKKYLVE